MTYYRVYFTDENGRCNHKDFQNKEEAIEFIHRFLYAWGYRDKNMTMEKITVEEINFEKI